MQTFLLNLSSNFQKVFYQAKSGDTIVICPGDYTFTPTVSDKPVDLYQWGSALQLANKSNITIRGKGQVSIRFTSHGNGLMIRNCENIKVENINFYGQGLIVDKDYYFALLLLDGRNRKIKISNCGFYDSGNHGIGHLFGPRDTCESEFVGNEFINGGNMRRSVLIKDGAAIAVGGYSNLFERNKIKRWLRGIELECGDFPLQPTIPIRDVRIINNFFEECYWQSILATPNSPEKYKLFENILVNNNIIKGWGKKPENSDAWGGNFNHEGLYVTGGVGFQISNNLISDMWDGCGIRMVAEHGNIEKSLISCNDFRRNGRSDVLLAPGASGYKCSNNFIQGNNLFQTLGYPLWIDGDNNVVSNNHAEKNKDYGAIKVNSSNTVFGTINNNYFY